MAVTQRLSKKPADAAPIWLPRHDSLVVEQASARPADHVEGYTPSAKLRAVVLGNRWKTVTIVATTLTVFALFATLPALFGAGIGSLIKIAFYQAWTIGIMLAITIRVRTVSVGTAAKYWLAGFFTVAFAAYFANGPVAELVDRSDVWITPLLEEILKAIPLAVAVIMGRKAWRQPGLSDLMLLGFAVGAGYAFHEEALWERSAASGFELNSGFFVPSVFQPDGLFVVGQAVWTSVIALALGLILLHRHQSAAVVAAVAAVLAVVLDHMATNDSTAALGWVRQLLFDGRLMAVVFLVGVAVALALDLRRQRATSLRDHLFPSERLFAATATGETEDFLAPLLTGRYRRRRNGVHNTIDATDQQWPPRSEAHPAPVAELARLARAARVPVGPGTSPSGWAADSETPGRHRFVGPDGFTAYSAGDKIIEPVEVVSVPVDFDQLDIDEAQRAELQTQVDDEAARAADAAAVGPTTVTISSTRARPDAVGVTTRQRPGDYLQYLGVGVVAIGLFVFVRLLTAGEASSAVIDTALSLPHATNSPALIQGLIGAAGAAVALRGRDSAELGRGCEVGPGDDPTPDRPNECEA